MNKMKYWKLTNTCQNQVRLAVTTGPAQSVGAILQPGDSIICRNQRTPSMDAQIRRKFLTLDSEFDNEAYGFQLGKVITESEMNQKKLSISSKSADDIII